MPPSAPGTVNVLVPCGALGIGVKEADVFDRLAEAHAIACDAGSTDSGPAYLATGQAKYSRDSVKHDLSILMRAQAKAGIPLLIGSCGTSGCDEALDWTRDIALEIAREHGLRPRIALLYSEQSPQTMQAWAKAGRISPLAPMTDSDPQRFAACDRIVALMGPEPYIAALREGADIVLGGRTTDTAVLAAVPLMRGAPPGPAWHAGKIAECGSLCTVRPREGGVMIRVGSDHFTVEPLGAHNQCTVETVYSHMLYENSDPFLLHEPGGILDVTAAQYVPIDERIVRVTGSKFLPQPYTMKLEGARGTGYQTLMLVGIQDRDVLADIDRFIAHMHDVLTTRVRETMGPRAGEFDISLRAYGSNAVSGLPPTEGAPPPREVGLLFVATAETQQAATQIAKTCNPWFFHLPLRPGMELPSYAFPFSPAEVERGRVCEFMLNHVVHVDHPLELVRTRFADVAEVAHA
ncbi:acyclic terpene utilization AtuA family protein [Ramlibacter ginsenosidimutans]|uniref:Acyclic terpene utilization AtuA family protein n=1 Tax=Ramlibacter ginsenosidimutans TaxID=502333 RepID=A0A934TVS6_9BURK|nr:acyclic terpene utilization AtuA family protein [Ramlibacter ginsenosidimutans]MBK6008235.1 acyclic terpene utilization AtuA family protein [Ramlibacter ginsenosidimutans]